MRHGLVIGKFYPPHDGHHLLVQRASAACERVTVLVLFHSVESIPLELRVAWMREVHDADGNVTVHGVIDDHPVDFGDPAVWDLHEAAFRAGLAEVSDEPITAVFSSEDYGPELARRLGAEAIAFDVDRRAVAVSGTAVRADPVAHWELIRPPVRAHLARRVVVLGDDAEPRRAVAEALVRALRSRGGSHGLTHLVGAHDDVAAAARAGGPVLVCDGMPSAGADARAPDLELHVTSDDVAHHVTLGVTAVDELVDAGWGIADPVTPPSAAEA